LRWLLEKTLRNSGVSFVVVAAPRGDYSLDDWWRHERGLIEFQTEVIKYGYYRWNY
jgi:hypothetical protein